MRSERGLEVVLFALESLAELFFPSRFLLPPLVVPGYRRYGLKISSTNIFLNADR